MTQARPSRTSLLAAAWLLGVGACAGDLDGSAAAPPNDNVYSTTFGFRDIDDAPAAVQIAAKAVVRIRTASQTATACFISGAGILLTNSHVLGPDVCPREGCYVELTLMHQFGEPGQPSQVLFAVPQAVDVGLDMATAQMYWHEDGLIFEPPEYVELDARDPVSLLGAHVTVIGHPEGCLKKWTDGVVYDATGEWFRSTAYILPGDSGAPVIDDAGKLVGLVHRGPSVNDLYTEVGASEYSVGTASTPIWAALSAPLPPFVISVADSATADDVVARNLVYLNARAPYAIVDATATPVLSLLAVACDAALTRQNFVSPDDLARALKPCVDAMIWMDCRHDAPTVPYGVVCPPPIEGMAWTARFQAMNQVWQEMNGQLALDAISFGVAQLSTSVALGRLAGAESLQQAIGEAQPMLDFSLASYLAAFAVQAYGDSDIVDYVTDYGRVLHYERQAANVAAAVGWLYVVGMLTRPTALTLLAQLREDPTVAIGAKLYIEELQYAFE